MIVLYQKRQNIYEIIYAEIMMARSIIIFLDVSSLLFTTMPMILFARKAFLPVFELVFHQKTAAPKYSTRTLWQTNTPECKIKEIATTEFNY